MDSSQKDTLRLEAFSDSVFAFAITLLSLDLKTPLGGAIRNNADLITSLKNEWPTYLAFLFSFISILIMWMNHHSIFKRIRSVSNLLMLANGLMLLLVISVPFSTSLVAEYYQSAAANVAAAVYAGLFVLINISYNLLWYVATKDKKMLMPDVSDRFINTVRRNLLFGLPAYILAFSLAFFSVNLSLGICLLLWIFWGIQTKHVQAH